MTDGSSDYVYYERVIHSNEPNTAPPPQLLLTLLVETKTELKTERILDLQLSDAICMIPNEC